MMKTDVLCRIKRRLAYLCLIALPLLFLSSCRPDDTYFESPDDMKVRIFERLTQDSSYTTFVKGVERAGLKDILQRSGLYTAFAPTNAAFDAYLQANNYASIEAIPDSVLVPLINYHFMVPMKFSYDFSGTDRFNTRANVYLNVTRQGDDFTVNQARVLPDKMNIVAMNGAIHGIDKVLVAAPGLERALSLRTDLTIFRQLLRTFTLRRFDPQGSTDSDGDGDIDSVFIEESLLTGFWWRNQTQLITAFAPTDAAFQSFFTANGYASYNEVPRNVLELLINYHFLDSAKRAAELTGRPVETIGNESLTLNSADVDQADIELSNGYLHVVNKVLLPPNLSTLTGLVYLDRDKDLSMFAAAVKASAFADDLAMMDPKYTVFAPTNAAFTASGIDVTTATAADLEKIVRYHIVDSTVKMGPNLDGTYNTMSDKPVTISGTTITGVMNSATIIQMDKVAANGVLHKINAVLKPE
jgi:transforming growth factor-beta-induced protein